MSRLVHSGCGYDGPSTWDEQCPNCRSEIIRETLTEGETYRCEVSGVSKGEVTLLKLVRERIGNHEFYSGNALVRPVRVLVKHKFGEPVFREGTARDEFHTGTLTLKKVD